MKADIYRMLFKTISNHCVQIKKILMLATHHDQQSDALMILGLFDYGYKSALMFLKKPNQKFKSINLKRKPIH